MRISEAKDAKFDIWFIHGFSESGLSFRESLVSVLSEKYNLFIPDLPGFGVSPYIKGLDSVEASAGHLEKLIKKISQNRAIGIVAHSMGGVLGTWIAKNLEKQVRGIVSIEGNMTREDCFFSGKTAGFNDPNKFYEFFSNDVFKMVSNNLALHRYYASVRFTHPNVLLGWGISGVKATGDTKAGLEYLNLGCKKIYLFGKKSVSSQTKAFLLENSLKCHEFKNSGHWPMIDEAKACYQIISDFFI